MSQFNGFYKETVSFFKELTQHNNKEWFDEHRHEYDTFVVEPSRAFITDMGERLKSIAPGIHAIPQVNKGLFRINRDVRFSADKSPYKTHMGLWMWEGFAPRMECSGFYFHLEGDVVMFGAGVYMFPKHLLERYRQAITDPKTGASFTKMIKQLQKTDCKPGGLHYKKTPKGFDPAHPNADYLLYNGLHMGVEQEIPKEFYSKDLMEYAFAWYRTMLPLHQWLRDNVAL